MNRPRTRMRDVNGMLFLADKWTTKTVTVRVTKDKAGKTLSLNVGDLMILIPVEPVEDMIDVPSDELVKLRHDHASDMSEIVRLRRELQAVKEGKA